MSANGMNALLAELGLELPEPAAPGGRLRRANYSKSHRFVSAAVALRG
jgi:hypothetical protein